MARMLLDWALRHGLIEASPAAQVGQRSLAFALSLAPLNLSTTVTVDWATFGLTAPRPSPSPTTCASPAARSWTRRASR